MDESCESKTLVSYSEKLSEMIVMYTTENYFCLHISLCIWRDNKQ
jgi:hypothetical protein